MSEDAFIHVKTQFEGIHQWDMAPEEVAFLRYPHRHLFKVSVTVRVTHDDRDVEFFMLKAKVDTILHRELFCPYHLNQENLLSMGSVSCEMLAGTLGCSLVSRGIPCVSVTVQEDDENSATVLVQE